MRGDDRVRFCGQCKLHVYNLSEMPEAEAQQLVREREGRMCVRLFRRQDGTVLTRDCPVGIRALRQRLVRSVVALAGLVLAMIGGTAFGSRVSKLLPGGVHSPSGAFANWINPQPPQWEMGDIVMGAIALPPTACGPGSAPVPPAPPPPDPTDPIITLEQ